MTASSSSRAVATVPQRHGVTVRTPRVLIADRPTAARLAELDAELVESVTRSPEVVRQEAERLRRLARGDAFTRPPDPAVVVYRLGTGDHSQTGVVVEVAIDDYRDGLIRRHEATQPERQRRLEGFLETAGVELVPVTLAHGPLPRLRELLSEVTAQQPHLEVTSAGGTAQTVWIETSARLAYEVQASLSDLDVLYVADGHHRMAAADQYAAGRGRAHVDQAGAYVLAALFPADEMRILGYPRALTRPPGRSTAEVIELLSAQPATESLRECDPAEAVLGAPGTASVYLDGRWYRLRLRPPRQPATARECLDTVVLSEGVLGPLGGDLDAKITPLPGTFDAAAVARWCTEHSAIGFLLRPPGVDEVLAVADAGEVMPTKSTWFDPKAGAGPFLRCLA